MRNWSLLPGYATNGPTTLARERPDVLNEQPTLSFASPAAFQKWLEGNHDQSDGIWLKIGKGAQAGSLTYQAAVEVALCYGWIDGQARPGDDPGHWLQKYTPRRLRSRWSQINRSRVEALIKSGRMRPPGLREIERAKADGRWAAAYESPSKATVPADLQAAFEANPSAREFFGTLKSTNRYAILYRIQDAKRPETRARRIETFVAMLAAGETIHPS
jgi:uncharacterized protein YdeI (YjbR/CyaY-like superfamily)